MARLNERFERIARGENRRPFALIDQESASLLHIPVGDIAPDPDQPRKDLGDIEGLKASISTYGILQPIVVSPTVENRYLIIAGERRYTAAKELGLETVPAIVRTVEEQHRLEIQLVENLSRKDLSPLEEATTYQRLIADFNCTQEELAKRLGRSVASINQSLRLLSLSDEVKIDFQTSENVSKSVLLEIAKQPEEKQKDLWDQAKRGELTVKQARIQKAKSSSKKGEVPIPEKANSKNQREKQQLTIQTKKATVVLHFKKAILESEDILHVLEEALSKERVRLQIPVQKPAGE